MREIVSITLVKLPYDEERKLWEENNKRVSLLQKDFEQIVKNNLNNYKHYFKRSRGTYILKNIDETWSQILYDLFKQSKLKYDFHMLQDEYNKINFYFKKQNEKDFISYFDFSKWNLNHTLYSICSHLNESEYNLNNNYDLNAFSKFWYRFIY